MKVTPTQIADVLVIEPAVFEDGRGFFMESYNRREFASRTGMDTEFVQDNHSFNAINVLRGLHYQIRQPQGKLVRVVAGEAFDVAVDVRRQSPTFGRWVGVTLSAENRKQMWIPPGFAHGFLSLSPGTEFLYKTTDYYAPEHERSILWSDPDIGIEWPIEGQPLVSDKDSRASSLAEAEVFPA